MEHIKDDRGYNQVWAPSKAADVRAGRRCDAIVAEMRQAPDESVLEVGCGTGRNAFLLASRTGKEVVGADICRPFLDEANQNYQLPNLRYELLDFSKAGDFEDESFDYVIGNGILHHLYYHLEESLLQMRRLLKPLGRIIFWEPNLLNPYCYLIFSYPYFRNKARLEPDEMAFSRSFAESKLERVGYSNIKVTYRDFLVPGIPDLLIRPSILAGAILERAPIVQTLAQSLFITADK
jgi:SAM-dependent methyltransferase